MMKLETGSIGAFYLISILLMHSISIIDVYVHFQKIPNENAHNDNREMRNETIKSSDKKQI